MDAFATAEETAAKAPVSSQALIQRLSASARKAEDLTRRRAAIEARLDEARKTYRRLAESAKERYGTDDLAQLEAALREMEQENARKVEQFEADVARAEQQIAEAERVLRAQ